METGSRIHSLSHSVSCHTSPVLSVKAMKRPKHIVLIITISPPLLQNYQNCYKNNAVQYYSELSVLKVTYINVFIQLRKEFLQTVFTPLRQTNQIDFTVPNLVLIFRKILEAAFLIELKSLKQLLVKQGSWAEKRFMFKEIIKGCFLIDLSCSQYDIY